MGGPFFFPSSGILANPQPPPASTAVTVAAAKPLYILFQDSPGETGNPLIFNHAVPYTVSLSTVGAPVSGEIPAGQPLLIPIAESWLAGNSQDVVTLTVLATTYRLRLAPNLPTNAEPREKAKQIIGALGYYHGFDLDLPNPRPLVGERSDTRIRAEIEQGILNFQFDHGRDPNGLVYAHIWFSTKPSNMASS